ncbi:MAG: Spy/CpxP family protein refolding chaperone [Dechloromonas sp.]|nr:Spy/CpxP family protein refolding chaperone [Dechloromonas sp.]
MSTSNTKTLKRWLATSCVALALPFSALAFSGGGEGPGETCDGRMGHGGRHASMAMTSGGMPLMHQLHRLDLSEAQQDKAFEIMHNRMPAMRAQARELQKSEQALRELRLAPDFNEPKARALIDQIARQRADMEMARLQSERQVLDILTAEQRQALAEPPASKRGKMPPRS